MFRQLANRMQACFIAVLYGDVAETFQNDCRNQAIALINPVASAETRLTSLR